MCTLGAVTVAGGAVRLPLLWSDLGIDEVWTLFWISVVRNPAEILLALRHDNNHWLNSLYLYYARAAGWVPGYRLLSLAAGVATIAIVAAVARRYGRVAAIAAGIACAFSSLMVDLTTEARGYATAMLFAVAAYLLLDRTLATGSRRSRIGFQASVALGVLSHLTFLLAYAGFACWSVEHVRKHRSSAKTVLRLHAPIVVFLSAFYFLAAAGMKTGGGVSTTPGSAIGDFAYWLFGVPRGWWPVVAVIAAMFCWEVLRLYREGRSEWAFFAGAFGAALVAVPVWDVSLLTPRQLAILAPALFILFGRIADRWRWAGAAILATFLAIQGMHLVRFYRYGRGDYSGAAAYLTQAGGSIGGDVALSTGQFRAEMLLWYYAPAARVITRTEWQQHAPDWMITHDTADIPRQPEPYLERNGARFKYVRLFRSGCTAPLHWILYRRIQ